VPGNAVSSVGFLWDRRRRRGLVGILWGTPAAASAEGHKHARSNPTCARPSRVRLRRVIRRRYPASSWWQGRWGRAAAGVGIRGVSAGSPRSAPGTRAEYFKMGAAVMPSQDLGQGAGPVHDGTLADLAAGDRPRPLTFARFLRGRCGCGRRQSRLDLCVMRLLGAGLAVVPRTGNRSRCAGLGWAGGRVLGFYCKILIARAITSAPMPSDTIASIIISSLAHRLIAETSVGPNAVAVQKASDR
jgi:hypothetical protein